MTRWTDSVLERRCWPVRAECKSGVVRGLEHSGDSKLLKSVFIKKILLTARVSEHLQRESWFRQMVLASRIITDPWNHLPVVHSYWEKYLFFWCPQIGGNKITGLAARTENSSLNSSLRSLPFKPWCYYALGNNRTWIFSLARLAHCESPPHDSVVLLMNVKMSLLRSLRLHGPQPPWPLMPNT